jgi:hypothetical protein
MPVFADREEAGRGLAHTLAESGIRDGIVVGLASAGSCPRPWVAAELDLPLDVLAVRKVGHPFEREDHPTAATLVATKTARCVEGRTCPRLVDFGLRRSPGAEAGLKIARASYLAGFDATSNVLAGPRVRNRDRRHDAALVRPVLRRRDRAAPCFRPLVPEGRSCSSIRTTPSRGRGGRSRSRVSWRQEVTASTASASTPVTWAR